MALSSAGTAQIILLSPLNGALGLVASRTAGAPQGLLFSRDSNTLYVSENADLSPVITALGGLDLHLIGQRPDARAGGKHSEIEEADETGLLFGIANRGISFVDAVNPGTLPATAPLFVAASAASPAEGPPASGPAAGGTLVIVRGSGFQSGTKVSVGAAAATVTFVDMNTLRLTTPAMTAGPQRIVVSNPDGETAAADAAFTAN